MELMKLLGLFFLMLFLTACSSTTSHNKPPLGAVTGTQIGHQSNTDTSYQSPGSYTPGLFQKPGTYRPNYYQQPGYYQQQGYYNK